MNSLGAVTSTAHLCMKYPLEDGRVGVVKGDQVTARKCYEDSLRNKGAERKKAPEDLRCNFLDLDPRSFSKDEEEWRPRPVEEVKEVQVGGEPCQKVSIGTTLSREMEEELTCTLRKNLDVFAWSAKDMPGIDPNFICHRLAIDPMARVVQQRKRKMSAEKQKAVQEETHKLVKAEFIKEVKYPTWLANVVMVKKPSGKWRMCTDYTDLNKVCPKDSYPLPSIDQLVDNASGYDLLSFMDAYSGYNQIRMHPEDEEKTSFMTDKANYCYRVMAFGLRNAGATFQRLMD